MVEVFNDDKGIIWPESVAPFSAHLLAIGESAEVKKQAKAVYDKLIKEGVEVLFDDRLDVSAGEKFANADLIGIPNRLVVSEKTGKKVEVKKRDGKEEKLMEEKEVLKMLK